MLTDSQKAALHSDMMAVPELATAIATGDDPAIADYYNQLAAPDFYVWRTAIWPSEYREAIVWTEVDQLLDGKARIFEWITNRLASPIDASKPNIRQGIQDAFSAAASTRAALIAIAKRKASRAEKLLATGTGSQAVPATMGYEGPMSYTDASDARAWGG